MGNWLQEDAGEGEDRVCEFDRDQQRVGEVDVEHEVVSGKCRKLRTAKAPRARAQPSTLSSSLEMLETVSDEKRTVSGDFLRSLAF
jgi:hypothetical protein